MREDVAEVARADDRRGRSFELRALRVERDRKPATRAAATSLAWSPTNAQRESGMSSRMRDRAQRDALAVHVERRRVQCEMRPSSSNAMRLV